MEYARLIINYNGKWDKTVYGFYNYKGGSSKGMRVPKNLTYAGLLERVLSLVNVDLSQSEVKMKSVFQTSYRSPLVEINDDSDVEFLLCEDKLIPQVGITIVKKVDQSSGSVPATQPSHTSTVQSTEVGEGCATSNNDELAIDRSEIEFSNTEHEDRVSNHDFQSNMEDDGSPVMPGLGPNNGNVRHGLGLDGGHVEHEPDLVCQNTVNTGHHNNATSDRTPFHIPKETAFTSEDLGLSRVASSSSNDFISRYKLFPNKKELRRVLEMHALKENFDMKVTRSSALRYEVVCSDIECTWKLSAIRNTEGSSFRIRRYDSKHTCALDKVQRRRWQAKARKPVRKYRKQRNRVSGEEGQVWQKQCGKCGEIGHNRGKCNNLVLPESSSAPPAVGTGKNNRKCSTCGGIGHNRQSCPLWEPPASTQGQKDC